MTPDEYADALAADWPPLTDDQLDRLTVLLRGSIRDAAEQVDSQHDPLDRTA